MSKMGLKEIYQMHRHHLITIRHKAIILGHLPITNNLISIPNHSNIPNIIIPNLKKISKIPYTLSIHKIQTILN
jgi:hypothetical protein